jgi:pSer/pThr/pTyr-binding forkhead associated (FHA) protein
MSSPHAPISPGIEERISPASGEGATERVDAIACLDERVRNQALPARPARSGRYIEVRGPGRQTLLVSLDHGVTHIGRGLHADLRLDENSVSRRHAILVNHHAGVRLLDDRSSNGTYVNGLRITQTELRSGDVLVLGRVVLRYLDI